MTMTPAQMLAYLVGTQSRSGPPLPNLTAPILLTDAVTWRRFDLPPTSPSGDDHGNMACDCVSGSDGAAWHLMSYPGDAAPDDGLAFDVTRGDGGQVLTVSDKGILAVCTQDSGTPGMQYFNGYACPGGTGWVVALPDAVFSNWKSTVAMLNDEATDPGDCSGLVPAYTRYRLATLRWPFTVDGAPQPMVVPTLISEHYDNSTIANSINMERMFLGLGWGLLRWDAWSQTPGTADVSRLGYAPNIGAPNVPTPYVMSACRTWTRIVTLEAPWRPADYGWPQGHGWPVK